jgi:hypothetical protein
LIHNCKALDRLGRQIQRADQTQPRLMVIIINFIMLDHF